VLGVYLIFQRAGRRLLTLVLDNAIAGAAVLILYAPVIYLNGIAVLSNPNGAQKLSVQALLAVIHAHLISSWDALTGYHIHLRWLLFALALTLVKAFRKGPDTFLRWLCVCSVLAPLPLLLVFRIIPFERTWVYLSIPIALSFGFALDTLAQWLTRALSRTALLITIRKITTGNHTLAIAALTCLLVICYQNFKQNHKATFPIDYSIDSVLHTVQPELGRIKTVGYTTHSLEWYVAEDLFYQCIKIDPFRPILVKGQDKSGTEDALILQPDSVPNYRLENYRFAGSYKTEYSIFLRK